MRLCGTEADCPVQGERSPTRGTAPLHAVWVNGENLELPFGINALLSSLSATHLSLLSDGFISQP